MTTEFSDRTFICYAREDLEFVFPLVETLISRRRTVLVWWDRIHIKEGEDWDIAIDKALHGCPAFLIVLSPESVESKEVRSELRVALDEGKLIIPLLYKPCVIPRQLRLTQFIDMTAGVDIGFAAKKVEDIVYGAGIITEG